MEIIGQLEHIESLKAMRVRLDRIRQACEKASEGIEALTQEIWSLTNEDGQTGGPDLLSKRQREIFELWGRNLQIPEIAKRLNVSPKTIESHLNTIRMRLRLETLADLGEMAKAHSAPSKGVT